MVSQVVAAFFSITDFEDYRFQEGLESASAPKINGIKSERYSWRGIVLKTSFHSLWTNRLKLSKRKRNERSDATKLVLLPFF